MVKLSIIIPSIRSEKLLALYDSIEKSCSYTFEIIIISPYRILPIFVNNPEIKWIESRANPTICQQLGLIAATGDYVLFAWDDGLFEPLSIDKMFGLLGRHYGENVAISGKYIEGDTAPDYMNSNDYYMIKTHTKAASSLLPDDFMLVNTGLISRETLLSLGGFDCRFESTAISAVDMAIRLQLHGVKVILSDDIVLKCSWLEGDAGDHAPVNAAVENDFNLLHKKYRQPIFSKRIIIPLDNYKQQPKVWDRRFS